MDRLAALLGLTRPASSTNTNPKGCTMAHRPRTFTLCSPHMTGHHHGHDIAHFQHLLNTRLREWNVDHQIKPDDEYGPKTRQAAKTVMYGLGIPQSMIEHGVSHELRQLIAHPTRRTRAMRKRAAGRAHWRARLVKRYQKSGPDMFADYLHSMVGVHEDPPGSNLGPHITDMERLTGYTPPPGVYWCGCLQNAALVAAGLPPETWMGYCPSIEAHARAGIDGWKWHPANATPRKGWLALFTEGDVAGHVEGVVADGLPLRTVGGNTSQGDGSPNNGGGVYHHNFGVYRGLPLRGFAEPPYHKA